MLKVGDLVKYTPQWSSEEERPLTFIILEVRDHRKDGFINDLRYLIQCTTPLSEGSIFYSSEIVSHEMIELA